MIDVSGQIISPVLHVWNVRKSSLLTSSHTDIAISTYSSVDSRNDLILQLPNTEYSSDADISNGITQNFTQTEFEYLAAPILRSVTPKLGLASEAGAVLNIYGEQFPASHFAKTSINEL